MYPQHPECLPIPVSPQDHFFGPLGIRCLEFARSGPAPKEDCEFGPREQLTQVTSYLDASMVYSSHPFVTDSLRLFRNGEWPEIRFLSLFSFSLKFHTPTTHCAIILYFLCPRSVAVRKDSVAQAGAGQNGSRHLQTRVVIHELLQSRRRPARRAARPHFPPRRFSQAAQ